MSEIDQEIQKLYNKLWRIQNPEKYKKSYSESNKRYYQKNKERLNKKRIENLRKKNELSRM